LDPKKAASPKVVRRKKGEIPGTARDTTDDGRKRTRSLLSGTKSSDISTEDDARATQTETSGKRTSHSVIFPDLNAPVRKTGFSTKDNSGRSLSTATDRRGLRTSSREISAGVGTSLHRSESGGQMDDTNGEARIQRVVVFDLETQKLAHEVGGWRNIRKMMLSLGVAYSDAEGFRTFTEDNVSELIEMLKAADLVVGFNQMGFDYEVLAAYTRENLRALPNLDILAVVKEVLGFRLALDHLAQFTLGKKKSGDGTMAATWFREGKMDLLQQYCQDDVAITRDLYEFGKENGFLRYQRKGGTVAKVSVNWPASVK
jgi:hypothetical protein